MKPDETLKVYFICKSCGEIYEQAPYKCEICGNKEFKSKLMKEE